MSRPRAIDLSEAFEDGSRDIQAGSLTVAFLQTNDDIDFIRQAFDGVPLSDDELRFAAEKRGEIFRAHSTAIEHSISVGTYLIALRHTLTKQAFRHFIEADGILPFKSNYAFKIMAVAEEMETFRDLVGDTFDVKRLPPVNVCYLLTTLPPRELKASVTLLQAPTTTMRVVTEIKSRLKNKPVGDSHELSNAKKRLRQLEIEIAEVQARIRVLEEQSLG